MHIFIHALQVSTTVMRDHVDLYCLHERQQYSRTISYPHAHNSCSGQGTASSPALIGQCLTTRRTKVGLIVRFIKSSASSLAESRALFQCQCLLRPNGSRNVGPKISGALCFGQRMDVAMTRRIASRSLCRCPVSGFHKLNRRGAGQTWCDVEIMAGSST